MSGLVTSAQLSPAQWALLSAKELKFLANTCYRDSARCHSNSNPMYICEKNVGDFAYLFPAEDAELCHKDKITQTI